MSCGCQITDAHRTNAVMCATCRYRPEPGPAQACGVDGCSIALRVMGREPCPIGRHADADGVCRIDGVEFIGVPFYIQWLVRSRLGRWFYGVQLAKPLPECGCYAPLKRWWNQLRGRGT